MPLLPKVIYRVNLSPIKIPRAFPTEGDQTMFWEEELRVQCVWRPVWRLPSSARKHYLLLFPRSARQSPAQLPSLAGEYVYKTETKWRKPCHEHQRGKRWLPDDWSLPGVSSFELRVGKRKLGACPIASLGTVCHANVLQSSGALQPPNRPVTV